MYNNMVRMLRSLAVLFVVCLPGIPAGDKLSLEAAASRQSAHGPACPKECKACTAAIEKALRYLKQSSSQKTMPRIETTALKGLAFLAEGSTPSKGPYAEEIRKCLATIKSVRESFYGTDQLTRNWRLAFEALFLTEVYHKEPNDEVKQRLGELAKELAQLQEKDGGWAHGPKRITDYVALNAATTLCLAALINIKKAGLEADENAIKKAIGYLERSTIEGVPKPYNSYNGSIGYSPEKAKFKNNRFYPPSPARTGMGLYDVIMYGKSATQHPYSKWAEYLRREVKDALEFAHGSFHLCLLYTSLGFYKLGRKDFESYQREWFGRLIATQNAAGASQFISDKSKDLDRSAQNSNLEESAKQQSNTGINDVYRTSILAIVLQLPLENLAIVTGPPR